MKVLRVFKKIGLWTAVSVLSIISLAFITSFACIFGFLAIAIILPIDKWQNLLSKFLKKPIKIIAPIALSLTMLIVIGATAGGGSADTDINSDIPQKTTAVVTITSSEAVTSDSTAASTTAKESSTAAKETIAPTTEIATTEQISTKAPETTAEPTTVHKHIFSKATCTSPKTCSCGVTDGEPKGHSWEPATCTSPKTCSVCGETSGYATSHDYYDGYCCYCGASDPDYSNNEVTYVLNIKSKKFHRLSCRKLPTENRLDTTMSRDEVLNEGYNPCGLCHP